MQRPTHGLLRKPAVALTFSECSGAGEAIARAVGFESIQRRAVPRITLGGFDAPLTRAHIEGQIR